MKKTILEFLKDAVGNSSSMRLVFVVATFGIVSCVLSVWTYVSLKTLAVSDLPAGIVAFAIGVIGTLAGVKAYQKKVEGDTDVAIVKAEDPSASAEAVAPAETEPEG